MGAGQFPAQGPAGYDWAVPGAPRVVRTYPRALQFDPSTRRYVMNADGSMADVHPVDAQVVARFSFDKASIPSVPTVGNRVRARVNRVDPAKVPSIVQDEVQKVLADLIAKGDVQLVSIIVDSSVPSQVKYGFLYVNLRDPALNPSLPKAASGKTVLF